MYVDIFISITYMDYLEGMACQSPTSMPGKASFAFHKADNR